MKCNIIYLILHYENHSKDAMSGFGLSIIQVGISKISYFVNVSNVVEFITML